MLIYCLKMQPVYRNWGAGTGRYQGRREGDNKRFLIQVIPKVGRMQ